MRTKHNPNNPVMDHQMDPKYFSVDARYHSMKNLPPEIRAKLRENLNPYQPPPMGQFQHPTMAPGKIIFKKYKYYIKYANYFLKIYF